MCVISCENDSRNILDNELKFINEIITDVHNILNHSKDNEDIFVIYDDIDLPFGDIRISFDRGSGGHNGIKSTTESISGNDYLRLTTDM